MCNPQAQSLLLWLWPWRLCGFSVPGGCLPWGVGWPYSGDSLYQASQGPGLYDSVMKSNFKCSCSLTICKALLWNCKPKHNETAKLMSSFFFSFKTGNLHLYSFPKIAHIEWSKQKPLIFPQSYMWSLLWWFKGEGSLNKETIEVQRIFCFCSTVLSWCPQAVNSLQRAKYAP